MTYLIDYFHLHQNKIKIVYFLILFIFIKEWIVINEEFLIGLSFLILFYLIQKFVSDFIILELDNRNTELYILVSSLLKLKLNIQKKLLKLYTKKLRFFKILRLITCKVEDYTYNISLHYNLITKENFNRYTKNLVITHIIKHNVKLFIIYNLILKKLNLDIK